MGQTHAKAAAAPAAHLARGFEMNVFTFLLGFAAQVPRPSPSARVAIPFSSDTVVLFPVSAFQLLRSAHSCFEQPWHTQPALCL